MIWRNPGLRFRRGMYVSYIWYPYVPLELFTLPFPDIICSNLQGALVLSLKIVIPMGLQGPGSKADALSIPTSPWFYSLFSFGVLPSQRHLPTDLDFQQWLFLEWRVIQSIQWYCYPLDLVCMQLNYPHWKVDHHCGLIFLPWCGCCLLPGSTVWSLSVFFFIYYDFAPRLPVLCDYFTSTTPLNHFLLRWCTHIMHTKRLPLLLMPYLFLTHDNISIFQKSRLSISGYRCWLKTFLLCHQFFHIWSWPTHGLWAPSSHSQFPTVSRHYSCLHCHISIPHLYLECPSPLVCVRVVIL